jgi:hypothetical protein
VRRSAINLQKKEALSLADVVINAIEIVQEYLDRENEHGII